VTIIVALTDLPSSVQSVELVNAMLDGANAKASRVAPCLTWDGTDPAMPAPTVDQLSEARLVLIGAITRWSQAGSGALQAQTAGPFGQTIDTRQRTGYNLWPSEIEQLQAVCKAITQRKAFAVDTAPDVTGEHAPWCSLAFGALYCSCGVDIAGYPIFEPY
jgi:hypothetical protein